MIKKNVKKFNFGFGILKVILALDVVRQHCFNPKTTKNKIILLYFANRLVHVPSFFILSFYFSHKELILTNFNLLYKRLQRLLIPYIGWPLIIYFLNNFLLQKIFISIKYIPFKNLKNQILWSFNFTGQLWFLWDLIAMTILFFTIILIFRKYHLFILQLLAIFAYVLQYSGYNMKFYYFLNIDKRECLGRLMEIAPYASMGFSLASFKVIDYIQKSKIKTFIFSILIFNLVEKYNVFTNIKGITYQGILLNVRSVCLIFIFSFFPSEKIKNTKVIYILKYFTNYTAIVFYLHITVFKYFRGFIEPINNRTFLGCIYIYLICYSISFLFMKIFGKTILRNLFS